mmetsp:Transcript_15961/g.48742  ORF Transcript_15961/g.48742 Transcript_15961/m.48742 type:complete len:466 (-) Transcript_15961:186-1583(-)
MAANLEGADVWGDDPAEEVDAEILALSTEDLKMRTRMLDSVARTQTRSRAPTLIPATNPNSTPCPNPKDIRVMRSEINRINHEKASQEARIKDNAEKIKLNKQLPYLVGTVVEVLAPHNDEGELPEEDGAAMDEDDARTRQQKSAVLRTSTRQTVFLPIPGLVDPDELKPGDLVGTNKDSYLILEKLPAEYDSRVKAMEVDERPTEEYSDIGGCDKQIQELIEAVVLPMTHKEMFDTIGVRPPKGVLLHGPPGTGKTLLARALASNINATFLKIVASAIVDKYIGESARVVREMFGYARDHAPCVIFMDEVDAIGGSRFSEGTSADREIQRTLMELLSQLDGFDNLTNVKMVMATNRPDILDPALLRPGRLDRKIEIPLPNEASRLDILKIHAKPIAKRGDIDYESVVKLGDGFNGADLRNVCTEAGLFAIRADRDYVVEEDFMKAARKIADVKKLEGKLDYQKV